MPLEDLAASSGGVVDSQKTTKSTEPLQIPTIKIAHSQIRSPVYRVCEKQIVPGNYVKWGPGHDRGVQHADRLGPVQVRAEDAAEVALGKGLVNEHVREGSARRDVDDDRRPLGV